LLNSGVLVAVVAQGFAGPQQIGVTVVVEEAAEGYRSNNLGRQN
jgi:hypothetical protein